jgi:hypothetical protein
VFSFHYGKCLRQPGAPSAELRNHINGLAFNCLATACTGDRPRLLCVPRCGFLQLLNPTVALYNLSSRDGRESKSRRSNKHHANKTWGGFVARRSSLLTHAEGASGKPLTRCWAGLSVGHSENREIRPCLESSPDSVSILTGLSWCCSDPNTETMRITAAPRTVMILSVRTFPTPCQW